MKARLARDRDGDETLMPVFIFCATFIVIGAFVIALMGPLFNSPDAQGDFTLYSNYEVIGGISYLVYDPVDGYDMTSANLTAYPDYAEHPEEAVVFSNDTVSDRYVWITNDYDEDHWTEGGYREPFDGHSDFVTVYTEWGAWYNEHKRYLVIDYNLIEDSQISGTNQSMVPFSIAGSTEAIIITTPGNESEFSDNLWANTFNVMMGLPAFSTDIADTSMWTILGQLMTARLPNVHPIINYMISVPFWACIGFMVFTLICRIIPFIRGG